MSPVWHIKQQAISDYDVYPLVFLLCGASKLFDCCLLGEQTEPSAAGQPAQTSTTSLMPVTTEAPPTTQEAAQLLNVPLFSQSECNVL